MPTIKDILESEGPHLASDIAKWLIANEGISPDAARKRLSRIQPPVRAFPVPLFPKGTRFLYLESQRSEERFWQSLHQALRSTGSVFGMAVDGLLARRGAVRECDFAVISGATARPVSGQVTAETVLGRLKEAGMLSYPFVNGERLITIGRHELGAVDTNGIRARGIAEGIILDGLREWARKIGAASYNQIRIRGDAELEPIQQYNFDLAGPSYLLPLRRGTGAIRAPGFLVADVFSEGILGEFHIRYFLRKAQALHATLTGGTVLPILVAEGFTGPALRAGHAAGVLMATPNSLFGARVGEALKSLVQTLNRAAVFVSAESSDRLTHLVSSLSEIEGRAGNLRGPLFELIAAYLARRDAVSLDMGVRAVSPKDGRTADIDVLKFTAQKSECIAIECKGKEPGGMVSEEEVGTWLTKLPTILAHLRAQPHLAETRISFELWTSGDFTADARIRLESEQRKRTKHLIRWKNGFDVHTLAVEHREKAVGDSLQQHFLRHPLSNVWEAPE